MNEPAHPAFWWLWAALLSSTVVRVSSSTFSLIAILSVAVIAWRIGIPQHRMRIFALAIRIALLALAIRVGFAIIIGVPLPGRVLFTLPQIQLPDFLVGVRIGGPVVVERLSSAFEQGLALATLIAIFGLANSLSTPAQLIKALPNRLYGIGVAATLATTITPSIAKSVERIRIAQFLRGQPNRGFASWRRLGTPVLEEALARSIDLAAAMEARGYGRSAAPTRYRPQSWRSSDLASLAALTYLTFLFPFLDLSYPFEISIFAALTLTPAVLK